MISEKRRKEGLDKKVPKLDVAKKHAAWIVLVSNKLSRGNIMDLNPHIILQFCFRVLQRCSQVELQFLQFAVQPTGALCQFVNILVVKTGVALAHCDSDQARLQFYQTCNF